MKINQNVRKRSIKDALSQILHPHALRIAKKMPGRAHKHQLLLVMKLTVFLMTAVLFQLSAATKAQITLNENNAALPQVLKSISKQSGYDFIYADETLLHTKPVTVKLKNVDILKALAVCFAGQPIDYQIADKTVMVKAKKEQPLYLNQAKTIAAKIEIRGKVVDQDQKPLAGVSIREKGTSNVVQTNANGDFIIDVNDDNAILQLSYVGLQAKEVLASTVKNGAIVLQASQENLDEIVVTAYGKVKKSNLTDAVAAIDGKTLQNRPLRSVAEGLKGLTPGLNINIPLGAPEANPGINVRGFTGLNTNGTPLILIDGIERPIQDVNPNDIESISVLKDGASTVVYGSRAPYGIILITTKSGALGKASVNYTSNYKFSTSAMMPEVLNSYEWAYYKNQLALSTPDGTGSKLYSDLVIERMKAYANGDFDNPVFAGLDKKYVLNGSFPDPTSAYGYSREAGSFANDNYKDAYFRKYVPNQEHNISLTGGTERIKYYAGLGYNNTDGVIKNFDNYYNRYTALSKINVKAADWLDIDASFNYVRGSYQEPNYRGAGIDYFTLFSTYGRENFNIPIYNPDDPSYYTALVSLGTVQGAGGVVNSNRNDLTFTTGFTLKPIKDLNIIGSYTFRNQSTFNETSQKIIPRLNPDGTIGPSLRTANVSSASKNYSNQDYRFIKLSADYSKSIANDHHFYVQVGTQIEENKFSQLIGSGQNLISQDVVTAIHATAGPYTADDVVNDFSTVGYYGVFTYDFKEKYLLKLAGRADASSRFSPSSRWGYFPSISGAWNVAKENFWGNLKNWISDFKFRASWSKSGDLTSNGLNNYYTYLLAMPFRTSTQTLLGGNFATLANPTGLISTTLTWTKPTVLDFGADVTALKNRLSLTYDWYQRTIYDQVGPPKILPQALGVSAPPTNSTVTETRGYEFSIGWNDRFKLSGQSVDYGLRFLMSDYIGYVVKYASNITGNRGDGYIPGQQFGVNYVYQSGGVVQNAAQIASRVTNQGYTYPGYLTYVDANGDGVIDGGNGNGWYSLGDLKQDGFNYPRKSYSILPSLSWNNITLSAVFEGVMQWKTFVDNEYVFGTNGQQGFTPFYRQSTSLDYWTPNNTGAFFPSIGQGRTPNDQYILNLAHLRVRNVTLAYNLPKKWMDKLKLQKVNVYVSGENLGFIYNKAYVNYDPSLLAYTDANGNKANTYPPMRNYSFGLNIGL